VFSKWRPARRQGYKKLKVFRKKIPLQYKYDNLNKPVITNFTFLYLFRNKSFFQIFLNCSKTWISKIIIFWKWLCLLWNRLIFYTYMWFLFLNTVGYATTNDATKNECCNEQFLSIKSGCYNEGGGILSANVTRACAWSDGPTRFD